jgi:hypothetical protein
MKQDYHANPAAEPEICRLRQAGAEARVILGDAAEKLSTGLEDDAIMAETPVEVSMALDCAAEAIGTALRGLESAGLAKKPSAAPVPGGPTRQQGQFLAFIRDYILRNEAGVAPAHADFARFFNLTPPSVNSMLIRLERRRFIRRVPGRARAIELTINPNWIPPLDRPFRV